jgi:hypothetical protein
MGRPKNRETPAWVSAYLRHLRAHGVQAVACRLTGISYSAPTALAKTDGDFAAEVEDALEESYDAMEAELLKRAVYGTEEPVVYQGTVSYEPERDANGHPVIEAYDTGVKASNGDPVMGTRVKLELDVMGRPKPISVVKRSDALLMFALKGRRKRMYADRTEVTGADGGPQTISVAWADPA